MSPDIKALRMAYIAIAAAIALGAIVAAYLKNVYVAAGLIVLDGIIIFLGSLLITRKLAEAELEKRLKKD